MARRNNATEKKRRRNFLAHEIEQVKRMKKIFEGIKVIAVARQVAAPLAAYQLALHGAEVICIENPKEPDSMRYSGDLDSALNINGLAPNFLAQGANKRSMRLNLASARGQEIFRAMAAKADVVIENLVAGGMAKYGLDYESLRRTNKGLVYCSVTGFGQDGPFSKRHAIDLAIQAASGLMSLTGTPQSGPLKAGFLMADAVTGYAAALGIVSALYHRSMTGEGQYVDVAMLDAAITLAAGDVCLAGSLGQAKKLRGNGDGRHVSWVFRCKEGMLAIAASSEPRRQRLWKAIKREDIPLDPRFATPKEARRNMNLLHEEIEKTLMQKTALEWEEIISDAGVAAMAVRDMTEAVNLPQIAHRQLLHRFPPDSELGCSVVVPKAPYTFSETPASIDSFPPRFGQHTNEILGELGFSDQQVEELRSKGVI